MLSIPFYPNTKDNLHCVQACLRSALKFYFPKRNYSFSYLDKATSHKKGKFTWNSAMLIFLANLGLEVVNIEDFDYAKFGKYGEKFLEKIWTKEVFAKQKTFSDLSLEQKLAEKLTKSKSKSKSKRIILIARPAATKDIKKFFADNYFVFCSINPYVLDHKKGYTSHFVLITDAQKDRVVFHDPGLPPIKNRESSLKLFFKAMCYPAKNSASIVAIKKIRQSQA